MRTSSDQHRPTPPGYVLGIAVLVLIAMAKPILMDTLDPDCFWHLKVAEQILANGVGPLIDNLSFASLREPWTPYSWLAELAMLGVWNTGGWKLALAISALMNGAFVLLIATCCREVQAARSARPGDDSNGSGLRTILATAAAVVWSMAYLSFRPATLAIVLLALCAWLILRDRRLGERSRAVWLVIPLAALLTNIHLSVVLLPLWFLACAAGALWEWQRHKATHVLADLHRRFRRYGILASATLVASLATPMLAGVLTTIGHYQSADVLVASDVIAEMQPFWRGPAGMVSAVLVALVLIPATINYRRLRKGELLWLIGMVVFLFRFGRFAPLFSIIAAPVASLVWPRLRDRVLWRKPVLAAMALVLALGTWNVLRSFPGPVTSLDHWLNRHGAYAAAYPTGAADFVARHVDPGNGRMINEFNWGGFLSWRLGDRYQVLMDGRTQLYSQEFWEKTYLGTPDSRRELIEQLDASVAIVPARKSLFADTLKELGWNVAWSDEHSQVLLPPDALTLGPRD